MHAPRKAVDAGEETEAMNVAPVEGNQHLILRAAHDRDFQTTSAAPAQDRRTGSVRTRRDRVYFEAGVVSVMKQSSEVSFEVQCSASRRIAFVGCLPVERMRFARRHRSSVIVAGSVYGQVWGARLRRYPDCIQRRLLLTMAPTIFDVRGIARCPCRRTGIVKPPEVRGVGFHVLPPAHTG